MNLDAIKPTSDQVLVRRLEQPDFFGSLVVPDISKHPSQEGEVLAAGPGHFSPQGVFIPNEIQQGWRVVFGKYAGTTMPLGAEELVMLRESDIIARIQLEEG
jgi:chaperonin GroES